MISSLSLCERKALQSEQNKVEMLNRIKLLESEKRECEKILHEWKVKCEGMEKKDMERKAEEINKHKEEVRGWVTELPSRW